MGLAASQARILSLTSRQHTIEYQAQKLQADKLQLSNESDAAYNKYMQTLDATKVQYKFVESDGTVSYKDATYNNMFNYNAGPASQYALIDTSNNKMIVTDTNVINNYSTWQYSSKQSSVTWSTMSGTVKDLPDQTSYNALTKEQQAVYIKEYCAIQFAKAATSNSTDASKLTYYQNLYTKIDAAGGISENSSMVNSNGNADNYTWLTNMIENGSVLLTKWDTGAGDSGNGAWTDISVSSDSELEEVSDDTGEKKAEATYEADMTRINNKDSQYDTLLSQTDTERTAIKTEIDSLKQVVKDNIDKNFKLFS